MLNGTRQMVTSFCPGRPGNIFLHFDSLAVACRVDNDAVRNAGFLSAMKRTVACSLLLLSLLGSVGSAWAQAYWRDLPPDQRREMRQQMREHWQQEREIRREDGAPPRWRDIPPEDRRRLRDDMREQRGLQEHREFRGGGGRGWRRD